jgi:hypothetical protein
MVACGDFVVTTWLFAACFSAAKNFPYFSDLFLGREDADPTRA